MLSQGSCFLSYDNSKTDGVVLTATELFDYYERIFVA
jgi:hypothetical protein